MRRFVYILRTCQGRKFVVVPGTHVDRNPSVIYKVPVTSSECPQNKHYTNMCIKSRLIVEFCLKHVPVHIR